MVHTIVSMVILEEKPMPKVLGDTGYLLKIVGTGKDESLSGWCSTFEWVW